MIYDNSIRLDQMMGAAQNQMVAAQKRLDSIDAALKRRLGGRSRFKLLGAVVVSLGWAAAFLAAYLFLDGHIPEPGRLTLLGVSLLLVLFMLIDELLQMKYYGTILRAQRQLSQLYRRVDQAQDALTSHLQTYLEQRDAQWEYPLEAGNSVNQKAGQITARLSGMEKLSSRFLTTVKKILYYAACAVWTAGGSYLIFSLTAAFLFEDDLSPFTLAVMMTTAMVIACVFEILFARMIWGKTNCEVGNVTLLALAMGPILFDAVFAAILLVFIILLVILLIVLPMVL